MFQALETQLATLKEQVSALIERIFALENRISKTLPYTVDELIAKLQSI